MRRLARIVASVAALLLLTLLASNRVAVAVPCHRVVKSDGSISGYRWGVQRKRRLINMEGVA